MRYCVRFWNMADENIKVCGKYSHYFDTFDDAMESANAMLKAAVKNGAIGMDINNEFYSIEQ